MAGTAVGANIQNLSQGRLADYVTTVPDYDSQVRIAQCLSVYDNLIENNKNKLNYWKRRHNIFTRNGLWI